MWHGIERRSQNCLSGTIDHALDLVATHGVHFATAYLRNHRVSESTIGRVTSGTAVFRRPKPAECFADNDWSNLDNEQKAFETRPLSYKRRGGSPPAR